MKILDLSRLIFSSYRHRCYTSFTRPPLEPEPGMCCDEGCESCVWLIYATELLDYYRQKFPEGSLNHVKSDLNEKVESETVKAYVLMEISLLDKRYKDNLLLQKNK